IFAGAGQKATVRRISHTSNFARMSLQRKQPAGASYVPERNRAIFRPSGKRFSSAGKRHTANGLVVAAGEDAILCAQLVIQSPGEIAQIRRAALAIAQQLECSPWIRFPGLPDA